MQLRHGKRLSKTANQSKSKAKTSKSKDNDDKHGGKGDKSTTSPKANNINGAKGDHTTSPAATKATGINGDTGGATIANKPPGLETANDEAIAHALEQSLNARADTNAQGNKSVDTNTRRGLNNDKGNDSQDDVSDDDDYVPDLDQQARQDEMLFEKYKLEMMKQKALAEASAAKFYAFRKSKGYVTGTPGDKQGTRQDPVGTTRQDPVGAVRQVPTIYDNLASSINNFNTHIVPSNNYRVSSLDRNTRISKPVATLGSFHARPTDTDPQFSPLVRRDRTNTYSYPIPNYSKNSTPSHKQYTHVPHTHIDTRVTKNVGTHDQPTTHVPYTGMYNRQRTQYGRQPVKTREPSTNSYNYSHSEQPVRSDNLGFYRKNLEYDDLMRKCSKLEKMADRYHRKCDETKMLKLEINALKAQHRSIMDPNRGDLGQFVQRDPLIFSKILGQVQQLKLQSLFTMNKYKRGISTFSSKLPTEVSTLVPKLKNVRPNPVMLKALRQWQEHFIKYRMYLNDHRMMAIMQDNMHVILQHDVIGAIDRGEISTYLHIMAYLIHEFGMPYNHRSSQKYVEDLRITTDKPSIIITVIKNYLESYYFALNTYNEVNRQYRLPKNREFNELNIVEIIMDQLARQKELWMELKRVVAQTFGDPNANLDLFRLLYCLEILYQTWTYKGFSKIGRFTFNNFKGRFNNKYKSKYKPVVNALNCNDSEQLVHLLESFDPDTQFACVTYSKWSELYEDNESKSDCEQAHAHLPENAAQVHLTDEEYDMINAITEHLCWNCGGPNHKANKCTKPRNKLVYRANYNKWKNQLRNATVLRLKQNKFNRYKNNSSDGKSNSAKYYGNRWSSGYYNKSNYYKNNIVNKENVNKISEKSDAANTSTDNGLEDIKNVINSITWEDVSKLAAEIDEPLEPDPSIGDVKQPPQQK